MKPSLRSLLPIACAALLGVFLPAVSSRAANTVLKLDFTNTGGVYAMAAGFSPVEANFLSDTATTGINNIGGTGVNFSINHVGSFSFGNTAQPLTTGGFYTFGNGNNDHTFTLSNLTPGSLITLYAVAGWDGNGRGSTVTFGTGVTQAQTLGDPGASPTLANFTQINAVPLLVGNTGIVTGLMGGADPLNTASEGQLGGVVFDIAPPAAVPEPAQAISLLLLSVVAGVVVLHRRRKAGWMMTTAL